MSREEKSQMKARLWELRDKVAPQGQSPEQKAYAKAFEVPEGYVAAGLDRKTKSGVVAPLEGYRSRLYDVFFGAAGTTGLSWKPRRRP